MLKAVFLFIVSDEFCLWKFCKLQTLAMMDWKLFSPKVQLVYHDFEQQIAHKDH